jgi:hypothetical protein
MIKKTFRLTQEDQKQLISLAERYRAIQTHIDETHGIMYVSTTFIGNTEPISQAAHFQMELISNDPPKMPHDEQRQRVLGQP